MGAHFLRSDHSQILAASERFHIPLDPSAPTTTTGGFESDRHETPATKCSCTITIRVSSQKEILNLPQGERTVRFSNYDRL